MIRFEFLKGILIKLPLFGALSIFLTREAPRVFMYHRFCKNPEESDEKVDGSTLEWQLRKIKEKFIVMSLGEFLKAGKVKGKPIPYVAILTIDDGYQDFFNIAYPLLKKYGCPATFFPSIKSVEGEWMWWDRLKFLIIHANAKSIVFEQNGRVFNIELSNRNREEEFQNLFNHCCSIGDQERTEFIQRLEKGLDAVIPSTPPYEYASVSRKQIREMAVNGIEIGSHTLSHPILSNLDDRELEIEISDSKKRLEEIIGKKIESFCYPYGQRSDLNDTVCEWVKKAGYEGAVVGYYERGNSFDRFRIPRVGVSQDKNDFLWKLCGLEGIYENLTRFLGFVSGTKN